MNEPVDLHIVLVHGTWGRGIIPHQRLWGKPRWFEEGGDFRNALERGLVEQQLNCELSVFEWSGSNSVKARAFAGTTLSEKVNSIREGDPGCRIILVCHSHGGNVAAQALTHISSKDEAIEIVTIATPFLQIIERGLDRYERSIIRNASILFICGLLFISGLSVVLLLPLSHKAFLTKFFGTVVNFAIVYGVYTLLRLTLRWATFSPTRSAKMAIASRHGWSGRERLLVLRAVDDEAALSLAAGSIANRVSRAVAPLFSLTTAFVFLTFLGFLVWAIYEMFAVREILQMHPGIDHGPHRWMLEQKEIAGKGLAILFAYWVSTELFSGPMTVLMGLSGILILTASGLPKSVYGRELALRAFGIDLDVQSAPDSRCATTITTLTKVDPESKSLRHALYDHPEICTTILSWLMSPKRQNNRRR